MPKALNARMNESTNTHRTTAVRPRGYATTFAVEVVPEVLTNRIDPPAGTDEERFTCGTLLVSSVSGRMQSRRRNLNQC